MSRKNPTIADGFIEGDGDAGARGVAVLLDVQSESLKRNPEPVRHLGDNPQVGLMGDDPINLGDRKPRCLQS